MNSPNFFHPTNNVGTLTSAYGYRVNPITGRGTQFHPGIDIALPQGSNLYAVEDGIVIRTDYNDAHGFGGQIVIFHPKLALYTQYGHVHAFKVRSGSEVRRGQVIGLSGGQRGTKGAGSSTGAHLHFEVRETQYADSYYVGKGMEHGSKHRNPLDFLNP